MDTGVQNQPAGYFDLLDFWQLVSRHWLLVALVTMVFTATGVIYALSAKEWYRAEVVVVGADDKSSLRGLGQLGGLASLAGIQLGSGGEATQEPLAYLRSRQFVREFILANQLARPLLAEKGGRDAVDSDLRDAVEYFTRKLFQVTEDKKTGLVTVSVLWRDPRSAAAWANELVGRANKQLQARALEEAGRNVKYLQSEIAATNVATLQQSVGRVLESEMQRLLLARGRQEFAFKVIDPAFEARKPVAPQKLVICVASFLLGLILSIAVVVARSALKERRAAQQGAIGR